MDTSNQPKRRRIIADDEDEPDFADNQSVGSNPDEVIDENPEDPDDDEGEDLEEHWMDDYAPAPELDYYDPTMLAGEDDVVQEDYAKMMEARRAADEELDALDARRREQEEDAEDNLEGINEREQEDLMSDEDDDDEEDEDGLMPSERSLNLEAFDCPLREWIAEERTRREIQRRFRMFLNSYYPGVEEVARWRAKHDHLDGEIPPLPPGIRVQAAVYLKKINDMCSQNRSSLEVSYLHLGEMQSLLAIWLTDLPKEMLQIFDEVLYKVVEEQFPHYRKIATEAHVRIVALPISDRLRDLRQGDLNNLVKVSGVVTRRTGVHPMIKATAYDCKNCGQTLGPFEGDARPTSCILCQASTFFSINNQASIYGNYQKLTLQESPGTVPAGRVPRWKDVILLGDLIDIARPGEEIEVTGIYQHSQTGLSRERNGFPIFSTQIEANHVLKKGGATNSDLTDEDKRRIRELSNDPNIRQRIIRAMAPSIYGHDHVKTALALSLFGGCAKEGGTGGAHRVRGDINILLLGDPGTAKSQVLKYAEKTAPRAVYTTGKGASAVGLTAGVHKDPLTREWTLEGGALVLADQGVCLIDEFDKMNEQDRTSIHEAMEQQTISLSKAGIVASLQARCAVIAAANPIGGRYDPSFSLAENVELTDPILQRFDILCVLQDTVDTLVDEQLATFVVKSHYRSHPDYNPDMEDEEEEEMVQEPYDDEMMGDDEENIRPEARQRRSLPTNLGAMSKDGGVQPLDQAILKKYITYARNFVKPVLHNVDSEKISSLYADLRRQSAISGGVPIAVRHIESVMRMSEASARMHLRDHVREDDVDLAIKVMIKSFVQAQKVSVRKVLERSFRKYVTHGEESNQLLMHQLQTLITDSEKNKKLRGISTDSTEVFMHDLENKARELNVYDLQPFYRSALFRNHGLRLDDKRQLIVKQY